MKPVMKRKAIGYRRVSSKSQADNFSLESQEDDILDYCDHEGFTFDRMFTDVGSGLSEKGRPQYLEMREYALDKSNGASDLVFWDLDRFTRNIQHFFTDTEKLLNAGINLHLASESEEYNYHTQEKWHARVLAAQAESRRIAKRTKRGQRKATEEGRHIGKAPWGYILVYESDELDEKGNPVSCGRLEPDPELWPHVLKLWDMAKDSLTPMKIAKYNNDHNVPSPSGQPWTDGTVRYILKNEKYYGKLFRGVKPQTRLPGPKENAPAIILEDSHTPAVNFSNWQKINDQIKSRHRDQNPTRCHSSPNALSGRMKCGHCKALGFDSNLELQRQKDIVRLRCSRKKKTGGYDCGFKGARLDTVMEAVVDRLKEHYLTDEHLEKIFDGLGESTRNFIEQQEKEKSGVDAERKKVEGEIENVRMEARKTDENRHPKSKIFFEGELEQLLQRQEELQQETNRIAEGTEEIYLYLNNKEAIIEEAKNLDNFITPEDPEGIRELLQTFIQYVDVFTDGHGVIQYDLPVRFAGTEDTPGRETIYFEKRKKSVAKKPMESSPMSSESCGLEGSTGMNRAHGPGMLRGYRSPYMVRDEPNPGKHSATYLEHPLYE
jgi:site-specific DNA recombinase